MNLKVDPNGLPAEGLHLEGELPAGVFELQDNDQARAISPLAYSLDVVRDDDDLIVTGTLGATFEVLCGRCGERFPLRVEEEDYALDIPVENGAAIDLTTWLREDILLALPTHPRCETGNVTPRQCPAEGRFDPAPQVSAAEPHEEADRTVWGALDQLDNLKSN